MLNKNYFIIELQRIRALVIVNIFVDCFVLFCLLPLGQCLILNCFCFSIFLSSFVLFSFFLSFDPCFRFAFSICFSFLILSNSARSSVFFFAYSIAFSFLIFANTGFPSCCCFLSFTLSSFSSWIASFFSSWSLYHSIQPSPVAAYGWECLSTCFFLFVACDSEGQTIVYYVRRRTMRVIARRATMLAGDRSQGVVDV